MALPVIVNMAYMTITSTGTTNPMVLNAAVTGYQSFADAGVADADNVRYVIRDGSDWEIGRGTYTASGTTLTRSDVLESSNADAVISMSASAQVYIAAVSDDFYGLVETTDINADTSTALTGALTDRGQIVTMNNASANVFTIPANSAVAFDVGSVVTVIQIGAGITTITADTGVTMNGVSAGSGAINNKYQGVSLLKVATDTWIASGDIATVA